MATHAFATTSGKAIDKVRRPPRCAKHGSCDLPSPVAPPGGKVSLKPGRDTIANEDFLL